MADATGSHVASDPIGPFTRLSGHESRSDTAARPFHQASLVWAKSGTAVCQEGFAIRHAC